MLFDSSIFWATRIPFIFELFPLPLLQNHPALDKDYWLLNKDGNLTTKQRRGAKMDFKRSQCSVFSSSLAWSSAGKGDSLRSVFPRVRAVSTLLCHNNQKSSGRSYELKLISLLPFSAPVTIRADTHQSISQYLFSLAVLSLSSPKMLMVECVKGNINFERPALPHSSQ